MPNWVYTSMTVSGDAAAVAEFAAKAATPHRQGRDESAALSDDVLSFWNFHAPTDIVAYHDTSHHNGWYNWNTDNWGTKWDAVDSEISYQDGTALTYAFMTAWAPAEGAFRSMTEQHPDLFFEIHCREEQGWGVIYSATDGRLTTEQEWDIPTSHAEWNNIGEDCQRCLFGETSRFYPDCWEDLLGDKAEDAELVNVVLSMAPSWNGTPDELVLVASTITI